jgi:hypothetical protein
MWSSAPMPNQLRMGQVQQSHISIPCDLEGEDHRQIDFYKTRWALLTFGTDRNRFVTIAGSRT